jgi:hypothetical protein
MRQRLRRRPDDPTLLPADLDEAQHTPTLDTPAAQPSTPPPTLHASLRALQATAGNRAVQRLVAPSAQRHPEGPHELPMEDADDAYEVPEVRIPPPGSGRSIPIRFRQRLESAFNVDFSGVRVREGLVAPQLGAVAYTRGMDIEFARGHYSPHTGSGRRLLAHELAHVLQQQAGRVPLPRLDEMPSAAMDAGVPVNNNAYLESEASRQARRASWGLPARVAGQRLTTHRPFIPVVQSSPVGRLAAAQPPRE